MNDIEKAGAAELAKLAIDGEELAKATKAENTKKAYRSDVKQFELWCSELGRDPLPASAELVAAWIVHLNRKGHKPASISRSLTAINQKHVLAGFSSPIDPRVREILKGIRRQRGTSQSKAAPITVEHLKQLIKWCDRDFIGVRDKAILLVGWTAALRRSELAALNVEDLEEQADGLVITLRRSKADQEGAGFKVGLPFVDNPELCAVRALRRWLEMADIKEGAIFRRIGKAGRGAMFAKTHARLSEKAVSLVIKDLVKQAGYDPEKYSAHSLRAGLATSAAQAGIGERAIMSITGHKSEKTLRGYIRDGSIFREHPAKELLK